MFQICATVLQKLKCCSFRQNSTFALTKDDISLNKDVYFPLNGKIID